MGQLFCHAMPDGSLATFSMSERYAVDSEETFYFLHAACFELHRWEMVNPELEGEALEIWRAILHFDDYQGPRDWVCREITGERLPDYARRHAWRERMVAGRPEIFDDVTIPDTTPAVTLRDQSADIDGGP